MTNVTLKGFTGTETVKAYPTAKIGPYAEQKLAPDAQIPVIAQAAAVAGNVTLDLPPRIECTAWGQTSNRIVHCLVSTTRGGSP